MRPLHLPHLRTTLTDSGKPATEEELFRYNKGRFLVNEGYELAKRYSPFDIRKLCRMVSALPRVAGSPITRIEKKEGGYNKALMMTAENGTKILAKIPCRNIVPRWYGTASEVAVLEFGKRPLDETDGAELTEQSNRTRPLRCRTSSHGARTTPTPFIRSISSWSRASASSSPRCGTTWPSTTA
jgi:hypothetical protein